MSRVYPFSEYDKYLSLKLDFSTWLVIVYLLHPLVLKISTIQIGRGGVKTDSVRGFKDLVYPDQFSFFLAFIACIPVLILLFAYAKRKPEAPDLVRKIWCHGRGWLFAGAVLSAVTVFIPFIADLSHTVNVVGWARLAIAAGIIYYLATSQRLKDTFADFPAEDQEDQNRQA